jgi:hypothetical protein
VVLALLTLLVIVALAWHLRRRSKAADFNSVAARPRNPFASVELQPSITVCAAAQALAGKRLLAFRAPALPLKECTERACRCAFIKLADRRQDHRRRTDDGLEPYIYAAEERRRPMERRKDAEGSSS